MSEHTYDEFVPFKINVWFGEFLCGFNDPAVNTKTGFDSLDEWLTTLEDWVDKLGHPKIVIRGWFWKDDAAATHEDLCPWVLTKGEMTVFNVNESDYSGGGENDETFFANTKEELEAFCDDWGFDKSKIAGPNVVVKQTL